MEEGRTVAVRILWNEPRYEGDVLRTGEYTVWFDGRKTTVQPPTLLSGPKAIIQEAMRRLGYKSSFLITEQIGTDGDCAVRGKIVR